MLSDDDDDVTIDRSLRSCFRFVSDNRDDDRMENKEGGGRGGCEGGSVSVISAALRIRFRFVNERRDDNGQMVEVGGVIQREETEGGD